MHPGREAIAAIETEHAMRSPMQHRAILGPAMRPAEMRRLLRPIPLRPRQQRRRLIGALPNPSGRPIATAIGTNILSN